MPKSRSRYLGDGVYIGIANGMYVLTAGSHRIAEAEHIIWLEPEVIAQLLTYLQQEKLDAQDQ